MFAKVIALMALLAPILVIAAGIMRAGILSRNMGRNRRKDLKLRHDHRALRNW